jgi:hypothetical protein
MIQVKAELRLRHSIQRTFAIGRNMARSSQHEAIAALSDPAFHGLAGGRVEVIETHAGLVFLAGERALKIKKAVNLGYLDFSTLDRREAACRREWELNRVNAPAIYLGVEPVVRRADGRLALGGVGEVVEWAVVMRRFAAEDVLDRVAERGPLPREVALALADAVALSHRLTPAAPGEEAALAPERVARQMAEAFARHEDLFAAAEASLLERRLARALSASQGLRLKRAGEGATRRCHGDLHLANIVLVEGRPTLFDALEFDERLARIDVLYDLAFLLMDLDARSQRPAANLVLGRYLTAMALASGGRAVHDEALGLLAPFAALRAGVRAMVAADRADQLQGETAAAKAAQARRFFALAGALMAQGPVRLIAVGGLSGTGKSTVAAALAPEEARPAGALHLRSDIERKTMAGVGESARLDSSHYTRQASARVYRRLGERARAALQGGLPVVVDAVFARPEERRAIEEVARAAGVAFRGLWLTAPRPVMEERVEARIADASDADRKVVALQEAYDTGPIAWTPIDASGPVEQVTVAAHAALSR